MRLADVVQKLSALICFFLNIAFLLPSVDDTVKTRVLNEKSVIFDKFVEKSSNITDFRFFKT